MYTMRYTPLHSLLFSTTLFACQTKHPLSLEGLDETEDVQEITDSEKSKHTEQSRLPDAHEGMKISSVPKKEVATEQEERTAANAQVESVFVMQEILSAPVDSPTHSQESSSLGGIIGAKGVQPTSGGLGVVGDGLGGGGTTDALGGLGTKGASRGAGGTGLGKRGTTVSKDAKVSSLSKSAKSKKFEGKVSRKPGKIEVQGSTDKDERLNNIAVNVDPIANGEEYTDYGINPFVQTTDDALSTFSIDVDTASYSLSRRKIQGGSLPNYAAVRAEEFINYFDYEYDKEGLTQANPFNLDMEIMEHPFKEDREILRVGLQGMEYSIESRPALHLTFLVDVSGSMSSIDKLPLAKESMHMLVDTLREDDTVALATYAGNISKILDPTFGDNKKQIHQAIDRLNSGGSTAMSSGLDLAYEMAWDSFEPGAENRVIVLSDGDANVGRTGWADMISQIQSYADRGVTMSTMGFGMGNYKDTRMEQLSNNGDGNNYYIDSKAQAHRVFVEDFNSTMLSIARDVKIQVEFNPKSVQSYRLIGYENRDIADKDFRNDRVDAGEIGSGHNVTALYELQLKPSSRKQDNLVTSRLRYEKPGPDSVATERSWTVSKADIQNHSHATELAFAVGTFAELLRRSPYASTVTITELINYTKGLSRRGNADEQELLSLMEQTAGLQVGPSLVTR